jgi:hypothetical protein
VSTPESQGRIRRGPDALTTYFANGGGLDREESSWVAHHLTQLRAAEPYGTQLDASLSLKDLRRIYMGARVIQGSIIASHLALPAVIEAGETLRAAALPEDLDSFAEVGAAQTEVFLSGADRGTARESNDYPTVVKKYIAAIAGILDAPYGRAYGQLEAKRPELWQLALDADELQRLCWGHIRLIVNKVVPTEELASYRARPLQGGTDDLLALIKERTGVALPPRIMQRDGQDYVDERNDWVAALANPRQDPRLALLSGIRFSVENAEIATLYCLGSMLMRIKCGSQAGTVLEQQIRHGVQDIALGTRLVTHNARFQSRLGARPNYYRSFAEFLRNVREQAAGRTVREDGQIIWVDRHSSQVKGWCPAQNQYDIGRQDHVTGLAQKGRAAIESWKEYAQFRFGVTPVYSEATAGELLASTVLFATLHQGSPLRPESTLMSRLAARI